MFIISLKSLQFPWKAYYFLKRSAISLKCLPHPWNVFIVLHYFNSLKSLLFPWKAYNFLEKPSNSLKCLRFPMPSIPLKSLWFFGKVYDFLKMSAVSLKCLPVPPPSKYLLYLIEKLTIPIKSLIFPWKSLLFPWKAYDFLKMPAIYPKCLPHPGNVYSTLFVTRCQRFAYLPTGCNLVQDQSNQCCFKAQCPPPSGGDCQDKLSNCYLYPKTSCQAPYLQWAQDNCAYYCGFCGQ